MAEVSAPLPSSSSSPGSYTFDTCESLPESIWHSSPNVSVREELLGDMRSSTETSVASVRQSQSEDQPTCLSDTYRITSIPTWQSFGEASGMEEPSSDEAVVSGQHYQPGEVMRSPNSKIGRSMAAFCWRFLGLSSSVTAKNLRQVSRVEQNQTQERNQSDKKDVSIEECTSSSSEINNFRKKSDAVHLPPESERLSEELGKEGTSRRRRSFCGYVCNNNKEEGMSDDDRGIRQDNSSVEMQWNRAFEVRPSRSRTRRTSTSVLPDDSILSVGLPQRQYKVNVRCQSTSLICPEDNPLTVKELRKVVREACSERQMEAARARIRRAALHAFMAQQREAVLCTWVGGGHGDLSPAPSSVYDTSSPISPEPSRVYDFSMDSSYRAFYA